MTRPRPQSSGNGPRVVSFEAEEENERSVLSTASSDLHLYQCVLFLLTQIGYIAVVPSMLSTTFFEPTMDFCANIDPSQNLTKPVDAANLFSGIVLLENEEFYSLLVEWKEHCRFSPWTVWASTSVMLGAIFGSFAAGFLADRFGRKPVVVVSMSLICLGNFLLALLGNFSHISTMFVFFLIGTACGGYLVTNMVLLVEILRNSSTRLLVVSLNGWPLGMIATAFLAYILRHWRVYHLAIGTISLGFATIIHYFASESIPWLIQSGKDRKAQLTQQRLTGLNSLLSLTKESAADSACSKDNNDDGLVAFLGNNNDKTGDYALSPPIAAAVDDANSTATTVLYTYADLFRFRSIRVRLLTLLFCFGASSIISFGLYFSADVLPGSRYTNIAVMGLSKLALGFLPFLLSSCMGRRPILLSSIGLAMLAAWALIAAKLFLAVDNLWIVTALGLFMTGAIDPNWKIIHLLSIELFPTPVRNMARALCNVVARLGSLSGPWVLFLRSYNELLPFWVFAVLLSLQLLVSFCFLPETREKPLPDEMPVDEDKVRTFRRRTSSKHSVHSAHSVDFAIV